jgi:hypothetical protein
MPCLEARRHAPAKHTLFRPLTQCLFTEGRSPERDFQYHDCLRNHPESELSDVLLIFVRDIDAAYHSYLYRAAGLHRLTLIYCPCMVRMKTRRTWCV